MFYAFIPFSDRSARVIIHEAEDQIRIERSLMKMSLDESEEHGIVALVDGQKKLQNFKSATSIWSQNIGQIQKAYVELNETILNNHQAFSESFQKEKNELLRLQKDISTTKESVCEVG